jgi:predicted site-specific integrase-resolvase
MAQVSNAKNIKKGMSMKQKEFLEIIQMRYGRTILNKKEAAIELGGVSIATIDRLRRDGKLKSRPIRGQIMFTYDSIFTYIYGEDDDQVR